MNSLKDNILKRRVLIPIFGLIFALCFLVYWTTTSSGNDHDVDVNEVQEELEIIDYSISNPAEEKVGDDYFVPSHLPREIILQSINTKGYIQQVSLDQNNQIAVPNNVNLGGWYIHSVLPGEKGLSIIDGHVDGVTSDGVFANLNQLNTGDTFDIIFGDGRRVQFRVIELIQVNVNDAYNVLFAKKGTISHQLNLITCGGNYNSKEATYDDRIIVVSERIS